jgi:hypothetical protein
MSQFDFGNLSSPLDGADFFDNKLEPWRTALHSTHSGSSRPSYAIGGMMWLDTTTNPWKVKWFTGSADVVMGTINTSLNTFTSANGALANLVATTNPTVSNDGTQGYAIGSKWVNTTTGAEYRATSVATGAAVWVRVFDSAQTLALSQIAAQSNLTVLANIAGSSASPVASTLSAILDAIFSTARGGILFRGASVWSVLAAGTSGNHLATGGTGADPSWVAATAGVTVLRTQFFTASGTYTPNANMMYVRAEVQAAGGAGGGANVANGCGGGGGSGSYSRSVISLATIGASQTVTIGAAGTGGSNAAGSAGGSSSLGALVTTNGGAGGNRAATSAGAGGAGGAVGTGQITIAGSGGGNGATSAGSIGGGGGSSPLGGAGNGSSSSGSTPSTPGGYGGGGAGAWASSAAAVTGGNGAGGAVIAEEFCSI